ncbi:phosphotransferase family protein [Novosphingobium colocasiae]|uniref:Acyl-CoA dehydrogenase n=1 Tax=Novosphingobium colocasiae TaxID=1256513 RepID=A0A918UD09_9SPHN|nr:phosphotransferase family protein [Novosphingobium colocasiae]GGY90406.1 acyl-CoA dehydrogenase [Novosphingobium colocasiae]
MTTWTFDEPTREALCAFLEARGIAPGAMVIAPIGDGHSNLTFRIDIEGRAVVLRRPPPPPLPPGSNDVLREAGFLAAVGGAGLPVPEVLATGETGAVFDVPFYVMGMIDGVVLTETRKAPLDEAAAAPAMAEALVAAMAQLHAIDWTRTTLAAKARPEAFNLRHFRIFRRMVDDGAGGVLPPYARIAAWLEANVPEPSGATIIHNDLRLGNVMWAPQAPARIAAILDWELATVGDPLLDLAYLVCSAPREGATHTPVQDLSAALIAPGTPEPAALVARYFALSGRAPADIAWYQVMVLFKLATLYRYSRLAGHDPYFVEEHEDRFLAEAAFYCRD